MRGCGRRLPALWLAAALPIAAGLRARRQERLGLANGTSDIDGVASEPARGYRVAVLTSGVLLRFFLEPTARNLVAPLVAEGHTVDLYLSLNTEEFVAWHGYARLFKHDPAIEGRHRNLSFVADLFNRTLTGAGATVRALELFDKVDLLSDTVSDRRVASPAQQPRVVDQSMVVDFALHAPGWHSDTGSRGVVARGNALKLLWQFEDLWGRLQAVEERHGRYDFVIATRDDGLWVAPFSLRRVLDVDGRTRFSPDGQADKDQTLAAHCQAGPVKGYHMRCVHELGSYWDAERERGLTEYAFVLRRESAAPFLTLYSRLLGSKRYWAQHNLEAYMATVAQDEQLHLAGLPAALLPMQRAGRLQYRGETVTCLHKICDSATEAVAPLRPAERFPICKWEPHQANLGLWSLDPAGFPSDSV